MGVPPPAIPAPDQHLALAHLKEYGHGSWLKMQQWFASLDADGSGALDSNEVKQGRSLDGLGRGRRG